MEGWLVFLGKTKPFLIKRLFVLQQSVGSAIRSYSNNCLANHLSKLNPNSVFIFPLKIILE
jgi:hypothetical protein